MAIASFVYQFYGVRSEAKKYLSTVLGASKWSKKTPGETWSSESFVAFLKNSDTDFEKANVAYILYITYTKNIS